MTDLRDQVNYTQIRRHMLTRTIQINERTLVDVNEHGQILGIETLSGETVDWFAILADDRFGFRS